MQESLETAFGSCLGGFNQIQEIVRYEFVFMPRRRGEAQNDIKINQIQ